MYVKVHATPGGEIVAVCDANLIGRVLSDRKRRLDLAMHSPFYVGKKVGAKEAARALKGARNVNLVGKKAIFAAKKAGIDVSSAVEIGEVPHLQAYSIQ